MSPCSISRPRRGAAIALLALVGTLLPPPVPGRANLELALDRDLSPGDYVARTVARACGIAVGTIGSSRDTTVARGGGGFGQGTFSIVEFVPERWLKGGPGLSWLTLVHETEEFDGAAVEVPGWRGPWTGPRAPGRVLAFLWCDTLSISAPAGTYLAAERSVSRLTLVESSSMYLLPGSQSWSADRERAVRVEVARQSPDSLLARSSVVAVVRVPSMRSRRDRFAVLDAIRGTAVGDTLHTRLVWSFLHVDREGGVALLCLTRAADGVYEPTSMDAGVVGLEGDRVPAWDCTIADLHALMGRLAR